VRDPGEERFLALVTADPTVRAVLDRAPNLGVGDWWLTAGVLFQTVWNSLTGRPRGSGIRDADLFYFDEDTSWEAEDAVIRTGAGLFGDLPIPVEIRNEGRVHLWYAEHFGTPAPPFRDCADAIDHFAAVCCSYGVTAAPDGGLRCTRRTATTTSSRWWCARTGGWHRGTSTRPRPHGGRRSGPISRCCPGTAEGRRGRPVPFEDT
jgi:hypothetical protein